VSAARARRVSTIPGITIAALAVAVLAVAACRATSSATATEVTPLEAATPPVPAGPEAGEQPARLPAHHGDVAAHVHGDGEATAEVERLLVEALGPDADQQFRDVLAGVSSGRPHDVLPGRVFVDSAEAIGGDGDVDERVVNGAVSARVPAVQACYERRQRGTPTRAGHVEVSFGLEPSGRVTGARSDENTTGDQRLASCAVAQMASIRVHPGPTGGAVRFAYRFVFPEHKGAVTDQVAAAPR
jgi:hypothetical protein